MHDRPGISDPSNVGRVLEAFAVLYHHLADANGPLTESRDFDPVYYLTPAEWLEVREAARAIVAATSDMTAHRQDSAVTDINADDDLCEAEEKLAAIKAGAEERAENIQPNQCPGCGAYRLDGKPPTIHERNCPWANDPENWS